MSVFSKKEREEYRKEKENRNERHKITQEDFYRMLTQIVVKKTVVKKILSSIKIILFCGYFYLERENLLDPINVIFRKGKKKVKIYGLNLLSMIQII